MLFKQDTLKLIREGKVTVAYRKWKRPTVKTSGSLITTVGLLRIDSVEAISLSMITDHDAILAGFPDRNSVIRKLREPRNGTLYRIKFHLEGPDPRIALRETRDLSAEELQTILTQLNRMDESSSNGAWTRRVLLLISEYPGKRASDLSEVLGFDKLWLKQHIRRLKRLGITISLPTGYKLSPRGKVVLKKILDPDPTDRTP